MARRTIMQRLARWHIWLGWAVGVPLLLWTASGLFMAARPIDEVRGEHLRAPPVAVQAQGLVFPVLAGRIDKVKLTAQGARPMWIVSGPALPPRRFTARDGRPAGPVERAEARLLADGAFAGSAPLLDLRKLTASAAPLDLRQERPSWQARFADGTNVYIDADSGEVLALRSRWWRIYDFMWGIHIMDLQTREDTSNPFLWLFGGLAFIGSVFGTALLFRRRRAAR